MFSKKISLFVLPFLCFMLITNLFSVPVYCQDLPYTEDGVEVKDGELIYLVAQANGIKFTGSSKDVYKYLINGYRHFGSFVTNLVSDLTGFVKKGVDGYLNINKDIYNSIILFLRDYFYPYGYISSNSFQLYSLTGVKDYYFSLREYKPYTNVTLPSNKHLYVYDRLKGEQTNGLVNPHFDCSQTNACRWYSTAPVYVFYRSGDPIAVSLTKDTKIKFDGVNFANGKTLSYEFKTKYSHSNYGVTIYYCLGDRKQPWMYPGVLFSSPSLSYDDICYLLSIVDVQPTVNYIQNFNINNLHSTTNNVTITNIYFNETTNNITINNNGTQQPIDDNVQSDVIAPTVPNVKPTNSVDTLNNIDTIHNYHNSIDKNVNDFLIQFNDNLNKIDTNCYNLTSCAINGLKSVGNAVNDITGYNDKGMQSDIVLLICLFLLLGILFTIL